jgi:hypothetical protein
MGYLSLNCNTIGSSNVAIGVQALYSNITGSNNTAVGNLTLYSNDTGYNNVAVGFSALSGNTTGFQNTAVGHASLQRNSIGVSNAAFGPNALTYNTTGGANTALGAGALTCNTIGCALVAVGANANQCNNTGNNNVSVGVNSLYRSTTGSNNTAVGTSAFSGNVNYINSSAFGYDAQPTNSNQITLGGLDGSNNLPAVRGGTYATISDCRDKADIRPTVLGLEFVNKVQPVDYKWDMRAAYYVDETYVDEDGVEKTSRVPVPRDGSKKRNRYHHGVIAQQIKQVIDETGVDFAGYHDDKFTGGEDIMAVGYDEFIAPLIKSVQELHELIKQNTTLISEISSKIS